MSKLQSFTNIPPFINRNEEMHFLQSWIAETPNNILFLYGPKSSGKTTLIYRFIERNLPRMEYEIKHFNLRELLLINYESFLRAFFERKDSEQVKETRQYDLKVFKLSVETLKRLVLDGGSLPSFRPEILMHYIYRIFYILRKYFFVLSDIHEKINYCIN